MSLECPRQCIRIHGTPASATTRAMSGSARPPETSLTSAAPASSAAAATRGPRRVDAGRDAVGGELTDHRQDARAFDGRVDALRPGARRFPADVDECRTLRMHPPGVLQRVRETRVSAAVGKRVRRDVEDADHDRVTRAATERSVNAAVVP